jgi:hypothetical protein
MDKKQEKILAAHAVELGNSANTNAVNELIELSNSPAFHVKRLAVSALGKLAGVADGKIVVQVLMNKLLDSHAQVRQYALKALITYGADSEPALHDICDMADNPAEKDYNRRDAEQAVKIIEEAIHIKKEKKIKHCQKCNVVIDSDEFARSMKAFRRPYCDKCFDEVYIRRRNYDTKVELNKNIRTKDGTFVQSDGERKISEWLYSHGIKYRYDQRYRIIENYSVRPDFYLPEFDVYVEYWGMDTIDYKIGMLKKLKLYQQQGKKLISLYPEDKNNLDIVLKRKLEKYMKIN